MTNELSTTSILSLFQTTKDQRASFAADLINRIDNGDVDPLTVHLQIKCVEDIVKQVTSNTNYRNSLITAAETHGQKSFLLHNAKFEIKETGVKYDFSQCNDPEYAELSAQLEDLNAKLKARQDFLKTVPSKGLDVIVEGGEVVTVYPPSKSSTTNVAVTLK